MRTALTTTVTTTLAALALTGSAAATAVQPLDAAAPSSPQRSASAPTTEQHRERGFVLECTGTASGHSAYVNLYENDRFGHTVQIILDDDPERAGHREPADIVRGRTVSTSARVQGHPARVEGTVRRVGAKVAVHETHDDAGNHIEIDGTHRRLRTDLVLTHRGTSFPLTCSPAFAYDLRVATTPTV